jgi:hypothetical protein
MANREQHRPAAHHGRAADFDQRRRLGPAPPADPRRRRLRDDQRLHRRPVASAGPDAMYTMLNGDYIPFETEADNVGFTTQVFSSTPRHNSGSHRWVGTPTATGRSPGQAPRGWTTCTSRSRRSPPTDRPRPAQRRAQRHSTLAVRSATRPRPICTRATGQLGQFNALPSAKATAREHAPSTNGGFRVLSVMLAGRCACSARSGWSLTGSG